MIAQVYPVIKLPRSCGVFDYTVPEGLSLKTGDLVSVPFRGRPVLALVVNTTTHSTHTKLNEVISLKEAHFITKQDIARYAHLATIIAQSPSSLLYAVIKYTEETSLTKNSPPSRPMLSQASISTQAFSEITQLVQHCLSSPQYTSVSLSPEEAAALLIIVRRHLRGQLLIITPRALNLKHLQVFLPFTDAFLLSGTTGRAPGEILNRWRKGLMNTLITSRQGALLPAQQLGAIVVLENGNDEHRNDRRNPRVDAREAVRALAAQHRCPLILLDTLPRVRDLLDALTLSPPSTTSLALALEHTQIITLHAQEERSSSPFLSESLLLGIKTALQSQKSVLLYLNRKGAGTRFVCKVCGFTPVCNACATPLIPQGHGLTCPTCGSAFITTPTCGACGQNSMKLIGLGTERLAQELQKFFPGVHIDRCEKGRPGDQRAKILIATEYFFSAIWHPFFSLTFGFIADVAFDLALNYARYDASEHAARHLARLAAFAAQQHAVCLVQTWLPECVVQMKNQQQFLANELALRTQYHLPPTTTLGTFNNLTPDLLPQHLHEHTTLTEHGVTLNLSSINPQELLSLPDKYTFTIDGPYDSSCAHSSEPASSPSFPRD